MKKLLGRNINASNARIYEPDFTSQATAPGSFPRSMRRYSMGKGLLIHGKRVEDNNHVVVIAVIRHGKRMSADGREAHFELPIHYQGVSGVDRELSDRRS